MRSAPDSAAPWRFNEARADSPGKSRVVGGCGRDRRGASMRPGLIRPGNKGLRGTVSYGIVKLQ